MEYDKGGYKLMRMVGETSGRLVFHGFHCFATFGVLYSFLQKKVFKKTRLLNLVPNPVKRNAQNDGAFWLSWCRAVTARSCYATESATTPC